VHQTAAPGLEKIIPNTGHQPRSESAIVEAPLRRHITSRTPTTLYWNGKGQPGFEIPPLVSLAVVAGIFGVAIVASRLFPGATGAFSSNRIHSDPTHVDVRMAGSGRKESKAEPQ
jgi:hypothetical protein